MSNKPYGYVRADGEGIFIYGEHALQNTAGVELVPVYLHPKREWVGLTLEEIEKTPPMHSNGGYEAYARAIEAKCKEKNHD